MLRKEERFSTSVILIKGAQEGELYEKQQPLRIC